MAIEKITKNDIPLILDWHEEHVAINFPDSKYKRELFRKRLMEFYGKDEQTVSMVKKVRDNKMVGWLWLNKVWDEYKDLFYCDLHYIQVAKDYRGQGIGKDLMTFADNWARKNDMLEIRLGTSFDNKAAIGLYEKMGYKIKRILMEKKYE